MAYMIDLMELKESFYIFIFFYSSSEFVGFFLSKSMKTFSSPLISFQSSVKFQQLLKFYSDLISHNKVNLNATLNVRYIIQLYTIYLCFSCFPSQNRHRSHCHCHCSCYTHMSFPTRHKMKNYAGILGYDLKNINISFLKLLLFHEYYL